MDPVVQASCLGICSPCPHGTRILPVSARAGMLFSVRRAAVPRLAALERCKFRARTFAQAACLGYELATTGRAGGMRKAPKRGRRVKHMVLRPKPARRGGIGQPRATPSLFYTSSDPRGLVPWVNKIRRLSRSPAQRLCVSRPVPSPSRPPPAAGRGRGPDAR